MPRRPIEEVLPLTGESAERTQPSVPEVVVAPLSDETVPAGMVEIPEEALKLRRGDRRSEQYEGFDPTKYLTKISGKQYMEVKWRLLWLRYEFPHSEVITDLVPTSDNEMVTFRATVRAITDDGVLAGSATGWASESRTSKFGAVEKAETAALGRALAHLGFGTQFAEDAPPAAAPPPQQRPQYQQQDRRTVGPPPQQRQTPPQQRQTPPQQRQAQPAAPARPAPPRPQVQGQTPQLQLATAEQKNEIGRLSKELGYSAQEVRDMVAESGLTVSVPMTASEAADVITFLEGFLVEEIDPDSLPFDEE